MNMNLNDKLVTPLHRVLAESLPHFGVTHLFGLVGDANLFLVDHYVRSGLGRYIACVHEANAVLAALGFAQATGQIGVATVTHGPAVTNVVTALTESVKGGIPLVLLCGDTAPHDLQHLQKVDQRQVIASTGASFIDMRSPETALLDLERAFNLARNRRTAVVFNMRVDLQWAGATAKDFTPQIVSAALGAANSEAIEEAVAILASAKRPVILAGRAAIGSEARSAILNLAKRIEAPVATTLKAQGLFHGEDFDLGIFGGLSHSVAVDVIAQSDCIVAFGASLSKHTTEEGAFTKGKRVIQILPDAEENPRLNRPTLRLIGDIAATAEAMVDLLNLAEIPGSQATGEDLRDRLSVRAAEFAVLPGAGEPASGTVDLDRGLRQLHQALPAERVLVTDLGRFVTAAWRNIPVTQPQALIYSCHFGAIGCGLAEAVGAAIAVNGRPTVLVVGDGGFQLSGFSELSTVIRERLDLIILVCNDGSFGAEYVQFTNRGMDPSLSMIATPDFVGIAKAMGMTAIRVCDQRTLDEACDALAARSGPLMIDLVLDPTKIPM